MSNSLVRYSNNIASGGQRLFWDRVHNGADNLPFRGTEAPLYREEEFEQRVVKVADARNAFFNVAEETSNRDFLDVIERCFNGWFQLVHLERFWRGPDGKRTTYHYVEWVEFYLEDGSRTPYQNNVV